MSETQYWLGDDQSNGNSSSSSEHVAFWDGRRCTRILQLCCVIAAALLVGGCFGALIHWKISENSKEPVEKMAEFLEQHGLQVTNHTLNRIKECINNEETDSCYINVFPKPQEDDTPCQFGEYNESIDRTQGKACYNFKDKCLTFEEMKSSDIRPLARLKSCLKCFNNTCVDGQGTTCNLPVETCCILKALARVDNRCNIGGFYDCEKHQCVCGTGKTGPNCTEDLKANISISCECFRKPVKLLHLTVQISCDCLRKPVKLLNLTECQKSYFNDNEIPACKMEHVSEEDKHYCYCDNTNKVKTSAKLKPCPASHDSSAENR